MTSKEESASGGAPLAGAVRPDEKPGAGGSAPAPVPAGDAWALAKKFGRVDQFPFRVPGTMKIHDVECVVMERSDVEQFAAALSNQVPAGDAVALAAECKRLALAYGALKWSKGEANGHGFPDDGAEAWVVEQRLVAAIDRLAALSREGQGRQHRRDDDMSAQNTHGAHDEPTVTRDQLGWIIVKPAHGDALKSRSVEATLLYLILQRLPDAEALLAEAVEWETLDGLYRTTDKKKAMNWEPNVGVRVVRRAKATGQADQGSER